MDHVLAWNVIYHGDGAGAATALAEFRRVLRPGGTLQLTMLSKRHRAYGAGREIRPDTFVNDAGTADGAGTGDDADVRDVGDTGDKDHPHFYVDGAGLAVLLAGAGFEVFSMVDVDQEPPRGWHWVVLAETTTARPAWAPGP